MQLKGLRTRIALPQIPQSILAVIFVGIALFLCFLKLWMVDAQDLTYQGFSHHDDMLFIQLAQNIRATGWLGPYNNLTLAKGPFYPIFLAANSFTGIPLMFTQNVLYLIAITALCFAIRPAVKNDLVLLVLFALLVFQPASYEADANDRVLRASLSVSLALLTLAGVIRANNPLRQLEAMVLGPLTGIAFSCFWLTREDGIWLVPAVAAILMGRWVHAFMHKQISNPLFTFTSGFLCFFVSPIALVMFLNAHFYQVFTITEFQHPAFTSAYGALERVRPAQRFQYIPVTASTRYLLYSLSPAFKSLSYPMEVLYAKGWAENSVDLTGFQPEAKEIAGGWWMWALRDSVSGAGYYKSGTTAAQFYYQLANEINALCDEGKLFCYKPHNSMTPILETEDILRIVPGYFQLFSAFFSSLHLSAYNIQSGGTRYDEYQFRTVTNETLYHNEAFYIDDWNSATLKQVKLYNLEMLAYTYQKYALPFMVLGLLATAYIFFQKDEYGWTLAAIVGSTALLLLIVTIIHFTEFPAFGSLYLNAMYPLLLFTSFVSLYRSLPYAWKSLRRLTFDKTKPRIMHKGFHYLSRIHLMSQD